MQSNNILEFIEDVVWNIQYYYRELRYLLRKPKYFIQRGLRGYSDEDLWNLGDYYQELIVKSLNDFSKIKSGYPSQYKDVFQWRKEIKENADKIEYFKTQWWLHIAESAESIAIERDSYDYESVRNIRNEWLMWVVTHIDNLWD